MRDDDDDTNQTLFSLTEMTSAFYIDLIRIHGACL